MRLRAALLLALLALSGCAARTPPGQAPPVQVLLHTEEGDILLEVDPVHAPITAANFLRYVEAGRYDGGLFHRTVRADNQPQNAVKIGVVQAGVKPGLEAEDFPPIPLERTSVTGLRHVDGALSMARAEPDTATSDFFLCVGDQPELDFGGRRNPDGQGFAAFGRVISGMETVRRIQARPARGQVLDPPVPILTARRL